VSASCEIAWAIACLVCFIFGLVVGSWGGIRRHKATVLTLHDASGFTPHMDVRVSSGDGSEHPYECCCGDRFAKTHERIKHWETCPRFNG
jgi:hypothetical protein